MTCICMRLRWAKSIHAVIDKWTNKNDLRYNAMICVQCMNICHCYLTHSCVSCLFVLSKSVVYQEKSLKPPTEPEVIWRHLTQGSSSYSLMCCMFLCRLWSFLGTAQTDKSSPSSSSTLALAPLSSHLFHLSCLKVQCLRMLMKITNRKRRNNRFDVMSNTSVSCWYLLTLAC